MLLFFVYLDNMEKECEHKPVFGYDLSLLIMCEKCKKTLPDTAENTRKANRNWEIDKQK